MYMLERGAWVMQIDPKLRGQTETDMARGLAEDRARKECGKDGAGLVGIHDRVSDSPSADGSIYAFNETYIEIYAGALQERRGVVTILTLLLMYVVWTTAYVTVASLIGCITGTDPMNGSQATVGLYLFTAFTTIVSGGFYWAIYKWAWRWLRLENFVQRRLLIRFNRVTRQVYLHRPSYAGGLATLAWDQVSPEPAVDRPEWAGAGTQLMLAWTNDMTGLPYFHIMFVGKTADGTSDIVNLWEFIRSYMEEGPEAVPRPKKLLGKVPWPWLSLQAPWSFMKPLWSADMKPKVLLWTVLLSPVMLIHATGHWLSLLLCWEPRWPRIIREAGLPGKPVPPLSTAADWPPVPKVERTTAKQRRSRKSHEAATGADSATSTADGNLPDTKS